MATYCYFNQDQQLTINIPVLRWSPIIAILCCQGGFALGLGIIPYMYQVFFQLLGMTLREHLLILPRYLN